MSMCIERIDNIADLTVGFVSLFQLPVLNLDYYAFIHIIS